MKGFVVEGLSLVYRGKGEVSSRDDFLLKNGGVEFLLPLYFCREGDGYVFVYDLDGGYSVGDLAARGDGSITVADMVSILDRVEYLRDEYFFDLGCFYLSVESLVFSLSDGGCGLVYCPLYRGDFFGSLVSLVGELFSSQSWFMDYLTRLEALGKEYTLLAYIGALRLFGGSGGDVCEGGKDGGSYGFGRSVSRGGGRLNNRGGYMGKLTGDKGFVDVTTPVSNEGDLKSRESQLSFSKVGSVGKDMGGSGSVGGVFSSSRVPLSGSDSSSSSFSVLTGGRSFGYGDGASSSSSSSTSGVLSSVFSLLSGGFDWWGLFVGFIGGGVGNVGCVLLLFLFVGFVLGLFF